MFQGSRFDHPCSWGQDFFHSPVVVLDLFGSIVLEPILWTILIFCLKDFTCYGIHFGNANYNFFRSKPKNYSVIAMFTALNPKRGCSVCREANDEFTILANSYRFSPSYGNSLFFVSVDFDDGPDVFQSVSMLSFIACSFVSCCAKLCITFISPHLIFWGGRISLLLNACDVTVANSNRKNFSIIFWRALVPPTLKKVPPPVHGGMQNGITSFFKQWRTVTAAFQFLLFSRILLRISRSLCNGMKRSFYETYNAARTQFSSSVHAFSRKGQKEARRHVRHTATGIPRGQLGQVDDGPDGNIGKVREIVLSEASSLERVESHLN